MKARETRLNQLLEIRNQKFVIPVFQRKYSWTEKQCLTLWEDIKKLSIKPTNAGHFIGSIVCYQVNDEEMPGVINEKILIDGQQRLTTLSLIMLAIAKTYKNISDEGKHIYKTIMNQYILNSDFEGEDRYKLSLTYDDKETYIAIIEDRVEDLKNVSKQLLDNYYLFCELLDDDVTLEAIYKGINKLDIVYVVLTKEQDNPQLIFESMNSTGKDLSQGDLLRNYLLLGVEPTKQKDLYEKYWKPIEIDFGQEDYASQFDFFLRDYLTVLQKKTVKLDMAYEEFKDFFEDKNISKEEILKELRKYSKYYTRIYKCVDNDNELNELWQELKTQRVDTANPFLMQVYNDYEESTETNEFDLTKDDFMAIIKAINSYVYRRSIVGIPTNSLNKTFAVLYNSINKNDYKNSVLATLVLLDSYKKFPKASEFEEAFSNKDIFTTRLKNYTLEKLENDNHLNGIKIDGNNISVEHILPQTETLKLHWQEVLSDDWDNLQKSNMHRIGNLTITKGKYNSEMSDLPFLKKINVEGGISHSHYRLSDSVINEINEDGTIKLNELGEPIKRKSWTIDDIELRSNVLARKATKIWKYPLLTEEELKPYKNINRNEKQIYNDMNHLPKMNEKVKEAFDMYDTFILSLDEKVTKLITKHYIAYKYDYSNFVEIVIYKNSINILLDIPDDVLNDPLNLGENILNIGSWGTGTVRIKVTDLENYQYIQNLIIQSYEYQKTSE